MTIRRKGVSGLLTPEQEAYFTQKAEEKGVNLPELLRRVIDREYDRLRHIDRSSQREAAQNPLGVSKLPIGAERMRAVYAALRKRYGAEFDRHFGEQERELERLIAGEDLEGLKTFEAKQPWIRRSW